jgi:hypothetical protein
MVFGTVPWMIASGRFCSVADTLRRSRAHMGWRRARLGSTLTHNLFVIWPFSAREKGTYRDKRGRRAGAAGYVPSSQGFPIALPQRQGGEARPSDIRHGRPIFRFQASGKAGYRAAQALLKK